MGGSLDFALNAACAVYPRSALVSVRDAVRLMVQNAAEAHGCEAVEKVPELLETGAGAVLISTPNAPGPKFEDFGIG